LWVVVVGAVVVVGVVVPGVVPVAVPVTVVPGVVVCAAWQDESTTARASARVKNNQIAFPFIGFVLSR